MKKTETKNLNRIILLVLSLIIFSFFFLISTYTPLAGDDWGYAINGLKQNPLITAFEFYQTWSGRFFSELYGFLITPNKLIWNFLNASLFTGIFILITRLGLKKNNVIGSLLLIFLMFSVKDELRMETYTWLMGTTYVIPLFLALLFFKINLQVTEDLIKPKMSVIIISSLLLFYIGLAMENIAIIMVLATILFNFYTFIYKRSFYVHQINYAIVSIASLILLRSSPGAAERLLRDHPDWVRMSFVEQLLTNYSQFVRMTFIEHRMLIMVLSIAFMFLIIRKVIQSKKFKIQDILLTIIFLVSSFSSISLQLSTRLMFIDWSQFIEATSIFNSVFWIIFTLALFASMILYIEKEKQLRFAFILLLAGVSNGVMMLSPIFGYRSTLYTVYFLMLLILMVIDLLEIRKSVHFALSIVLILLIGIEAKGLLYKYQLVDRVHRFRMNEIEYYQDNPKSPEAWLIRYPIYTIHSGDIEDWDTYHMDVFKQYYDLNPNMKLFFYAPETSYEEFLAQKGW